MKRDTTYRNPTDPDEEVSFEDMIKGYKYGKEYVPLTNLDESAFTLSGEGGIYVLGFIAENQVPRHHYLESTIIIESGIYACSVVCAICGSNVYIAPILMMVMMYVCMYMVVQVMEVKVFKLWLVHCSDVTVLASQGTYLCMYLHMYVLVYVLV